MIGPAKQYSCTVTSDGESTSFSLDVSLTPFNEDFRGMAPAQVLSLDGLPFITSSFTGAIGGVTAALVGTVVTLTIPSAGVMPRVDGSSNVILYTVTFYLQFA